MIMDNHPVNHVTCNGVCYLRENTYHPINSVTGDRVFYPSVEKVDASGFDAKS